MLRLGSIVLALVATPVLADPRGRVVRVERPRIKPAPILCMIQPDKTGVCLGVTAPEVGASAMVVGDDKVVAEVRLTKVSPNDETKCGTMWRVEGKLVRGDLDKAPHHRPNSIVDPALELRRAQVVEQERFGADGNHGIAFDLDRDGKPDVVFAEATCPTGETACIAVSTREGTQLRKVATIDLHECTGTNTPGYPPAPPP